MSELNQFTGERATLAEICAWRAATMPERCAYVFLPEGDCDESAATITLDYAALDRHARRIAATFRQHGQIGDIVLLMHPPGPAFLTAVLGCWYAGMVAMPAYPPDLRRPQVTVGRLMAMVANCQPRIVCADGRIVEHPAQLSNMIPALKNADWLATGLENTDSPQNSPPGSSGAPLAAPLAERQQLALLQYTSGSSGNPRGVMLGHDNILANLRLIHESVQQDQHGASVLWLPPYHDMGMMNMLYSISIGIPLINFDPWHFLQKPVRWLQAISRYRGSYSGGPNFGFELCVAKTRDADLAGLDLSCWRVAFNGAETVKSETLRRFSQRFAAAGFSPQAHYPCYGLAEATVAVCGGVPGSGAIVKQFALGEAGAPLSEAAVGASVAATPGTISSPRAELVGVGSNKREHQILIVDPERCQVLPDGKVGEIWFKGPSVARGYYNDEAATAATFGAYLADGSGPYLRTGDLGLIDQGELYIAGRKKDLIIIAGQNHHAADLERSIEEHVPGLRPSAVVAFSVDDASGRNGEQLVIVAELLTRPEAPDAAQAAQLAAHIRTVLSQRHGVVPGDIVLATGGLITKTSSGKVQRPQCRQRYLANQLQALYRANPPATQPPLLTATEQSA